MQPRLQKTWVRYALAALMLVAALPVAHVIQLVSGGQFPFMAPFFAVAASAALAGTGPAVMVALASLAIVEFSPLGPAPVYNLVLFVVACCLVLPLLHQLREARSSATHSRRADEKFRRMADSAPVLVWVSDVQNKGIWYNKHWLDFRGRSMQQELGVGWLEGVHTDDLKHAAAVCEVAFNRREEFRMEFRLQRHDGEYRWVLDHGIPLYEGQDGAFSGYIGSCIDITERREVEERLRDADRRKDEFLAILAHELRNPLAPIRTATQILQSPAASQAQREAAQATIRRQVDSMVRLIDDLLDVSRITRGNLELRRERINLADAVRSAVETSRPQIDEKRQTLTIDLPKEPVYVDGDLARLAQVIANLLNNAAKYAPRGGRIALEMVCKGAEAELSVEDNGIGIPAQMLNSIWGMFVQADKSLERANGGLGIGLTIVRRIVEMHGGSAEAYSAGEGRGSRFVIRLPLPAESGSQSSASA